MTCNAKQFIHAGLPRYKVCYVLPAWSWKVSLTRTCTSSWKDNNEMWWSRVSAKLLQWGLWHDLPSWSINLYPGSIRWKHDTKMCCRWGPRCHQVCYQDNCIMTCSERVNKCDQFCFKGNCQYQCYAKICKHFCLAGPCKEGNSLASTLPAVTTTRTKFNGASLQTTSFLWGALIITYNSLFV